MREEMGKLFESMFNKKDGSEPTTKCSECYYFKEIYGVKTCGMYHTFLPEKETGCYGGWKTRNEEEEIV